MKNCLPKVKCFIENDVQKQNEKVIIPNRIGRKKPFASRLFAVGG
jgi:hypothetical protein